MLNVHTDPYVSDSDGDGLVDGVDDDPMNPDANGDGIPDGLTEAEYTSHPLWADADTYGAAVISLNQPIVHLAFAVLSIDDLMILLTTNAQYRLNIGHGVEHVIRLRTNRIQPVDLSLGRDE